MARNRYLVIRSSPARADLRSIHDFIAPDSAHYASKVAQDIAVRAEALDDLPRLGKLVSELDDEAIRELSIYSYRIICEFRAPDIVKLAAIHKRWHFQPKLIER